MGREDSSPRIELDEDSVTPGVHRNSTKVTPAWREDTLCEPSQLHGDGEEERRAKQSFLDLRRRSVRMNAWAIELLSRMEGVEMSSAFAVEVLVADLAEASNVWTREIQRVFL